VHESWTTRRARWKFNLIPAFRGTGSRIVFISHDWREVRVRLPLSWRTRNYVGTIFGGSLYGAIDPVYMIMLIQILGPDYIVWDKAANIRFLRPGRETLYGVFHLAEDELKSIKERVDAQGKIEWRTVVELKNAAGEVHASCEKVLSIRHRSATRPAK